MGLKIWLPLTDHLKSKGTYILPLPSYNTTISEEEGKISKKCMRGQLIYHLTQECLPDNNWTICTWVKSDEWSATNDIIFCKNIDAADNCQIYFSIINGASLNIGINNGSSSASQSYTFETGTWYHVAATYNGSAYALYINGEQVKTAVLSSTVKIGMTNLGINCRSTSAVGSAQTGDSGKRLNDFRLYNECLSAAQIKEISYGLVLHYKMDRITNFYPYPNLIEGTRNYTGNWTSYGSISGTYNGCSVWYYPGEAISTSSTPVSTTKSVAITSSNKLIEGNGQTYYLTGTNKNANNGNYTYVINAVQHIKSRSYSDPSKFRRNVIFSIGGVGSVYITFYEYTGNLDRNVSGTVTSTVWKGATDIGLYIQGGGSYHCLKEGSTLSVTCSGTYNSSNTDSYRDVVGKYSIIKAQAGDIYTASFWAKGTENHAISNYLYNRTGIYSLPVVQTISSQGTTSSNADGSISISLTTEWQRYWITWYFANSGPPEDKSILIGRTWAGVGGTYIAGLKLEKGNEATDWAPHPNDENEPIPSLIIDSSGYNNYGIIRGSITTDTTNSKYINNLYLSSGNSDYIITMKEIGNFSNGITLSIWFKSSNTSPGNNYHEIFNIADKTEDFEFAIHKNGYFRGGMVINDTRYVDNTDNTNLLDGNWHMLVMTYDNNILKRYVDGILKSSTTVSGILTSTFCKFLFGHYGSNTDYYTKEAHLSDARIYATALSQDDILRLYSTIALSIDNLGGIHITELLEDSTTIVGATRKGLLTASSFREDNNIASIGNNIYSRAFIEQ